MTPEEFEKALRVYGDWVDVSRLVKNKTKADAAIALADAIRENLIAAYRALSEQVQAANRADADICQALNEGNGRYEP